MKYCNYLRRFNVKHNAFVCKKLLQFLYIVNSNESYLVTKLNSIGWQFREGTYEHELYKNYIYVEELKHLIYYMITDYIRDVDKKGLRISMDDDFYCLKLMIKAFNIYKVYSNNYQDGRKNIFICRMEHAIEKLKQTYRHNYFKYIYVCRKYDHNFVYTMHMSHNEYLLFKSIIKDVNVDIK